MARLFLVNPPTDETVRTPLLSFLYLASALRRAGHDVAGLDASAPFAPKDAETIVERVLAWGPTLIGIHCKTLVPYPGTRVYDENHGRYGFTEWWIREAPLRYLPFPASWSLIEVKRAYADDAALDRNFFRQTAAHLDLIRAGLRGKADATYARLCTPSAPGWEPRVAAAGAR